METATVILFSIRKLSILAMIVFDQSENLDGDFFMTKSVTVISEVNDNDFLSKSHSDCDLNPKRQFFIAARIDFLLLLESP